MAFRFNFLQSGEEVFELIAHLNEPLVLHIHGTHHGARHGLGFFLQFLVFLVSFIWISRSSF